MEELKIRIAAPEDAEAIAEIYRPYVEETAVSFEYTAPPAEEMRSRMLRTLENYPYLVAELSGRAAGYAYAGAFLPRPAYAWSVELSIYLERGARRADLWSHAAVSRLSGRTVCSAFSRAQRTCPVFLIFLHSASFLFRTPDYSFCPLEEFLCRTYTTDRN